MFENSRDFSPNGSYKNRKMSIGSYFLNTNLPSCSQATEVA